MASFQPSLERNSTRPGVTDVLIQTVTDVMRSNSFSPATTPAKEGALAPEAAVLYCGRILIRWVLVVEVNHLRMLVPRIRIGRNPAETSRRNDVEHHPRWQAGRRANLHRPAAVGAHHVIGNHYRLIRMRRSIVVRFVQNARHGSVAVQ